MLLYVNGFLAVLFGVAANGDWIFPDEMQFELSNVLNKNCGDSPYTGRYKPENGRVFENPWLVMFRHPEELDMFCQGTLITDRHVLTTAVCSEAIIINETIVIIGEYDRSMSTNCKPGNTCSITQMVELTLLRITIHPGFENETYENDIALVTLNQKVVNSNSFVAINVKPICLPLTPIMSSQIHSPIIYNTLWTTEDNIPKQIQMKYIPQTICQKFMRDLLELNEGQLCAQYALRSEVRLISGSGSPLLIEYHDRMFQIGILSIGLRDATNIEPYVYVNISTHVKWIHDTVFVETKE